MLVNMRKMFRETKFVKGLESSALPDTTSIGQLASVANSFTNTSWLDFLLETPPQEGNRRNRKTISCSR